MSVKSFIFYPSPLNVFIVAKQKKFKRYTFMGIYRTLSMYAWDGGVLKIPFRPTTIL